MVQVQGHEVRIATATYIARFGVCLVCLTMPLAILCSAGRCNDSGAARLFAWCFRDCAIDSLYRDAHYNATTSGATEGASGAVHSLL